MTAVSAVEVQATRPMKTNRKAKSDKEVHFQKKMGEHLRQLRLNAGLEREELCQQLKTRYNDISGFNVTSMLKVEDGERSLTPMRIYCLADYWNIPISALFSDDCVMREVRLLKQSEVGVVVFKDFMRLKRGDTIFTSPVSIDSIENEQHELGGYYYLKIHNSNQFMYIQNKDNTFNIRLGNEKSTKSFFGVLETLKEAEGIFKIHSSVASDL